MFLGRNSCWEGFSIADSANLVPCSVGLNVWCILEKRFSTSHFIVLLVLMIAFGGCSRPQISQPLKSEVSTEQRLTLAFIEEAELAELTARRWASEGHLEPAIENLSLAQLQEAGYEFAANVDVIVFPFGIYGDLIAGGQLLEIDERNLPASVSFNRTNFLGQFRSNLTRYGSQTLALPLGAPHLALFYRADLLPEGAPQYWSDLEAAWGALPSNDEKTLLPWLEPLADRWAAHSFLARAAGAIRFRGKISTVFDLNTLEPLIATEPFEKVLAEMVVQHQRLGTTEFLTPAEIFAKFRAGHVAMAVAWPVDDEQVESVPFKIGVARLPAQVNYFEPSRQLWIPRKGSQQLQVDYLGSEGRMVAVASNSLHANEAIDFVAWLSSNQTGHRIMSESRGSGPFRLGHLPLTSAWTKGALPDETVEQYAEVIRQVHAEEICLTFPRVRRQGDYLEVLGQAVRDAITGKISEKEALQLVRERWGTITTEVGIDRQKEMLRKTEGLLTGKIED
jgi:ABC-type glycerol-3-phosphate transport system substrate-binding protein